MKKLELTSFKLKTGDLVFEEYANAVSHDNESQHDTLDRIHAWLHYHYPESEILSIRFHPTINCERFKMNEIARRGFIKHFGTSDVFELAKLADEDLMRVQMFGKKGCADLRNFVDRYTRKPETEEKE